MSEPMDKTEQEWRAQLSEEQFRVCREHATERAFSGAYWDTKIPGTYLCAACGEALFSSQTKYDSGSGWPSFWQPQSDQAIGCHEDSSHGMTRTEVHCRRCGSHLGHVFTDGPQPSGLRYCINSLALQLRPDGPPATTD